MERDRPSLSAQQVALARAHLTWRGVLDDDWAVSMLDSPWRGVERLLRLPLLSRGRFLSYSTRGTRPSLWWLTVITVCLVFWRANQARSINISAAIFNAARVSAKTGRPIPG